MSEKKTYKKLTPVQKLVVVNARLRRGDMSKVANITGFFGERRHQSSQSLN